MDTAPSRIAAYNTLAWLILVSLSAAMGVIGCSRKDSMGSQGCPRGSVWVVSQTDDFNPFCGQTCASSTECPTGMACVKDIFNYAVPMVPVCMSDSVPPPLAAPGYIAVDSPLSTCLDSVTLGKLYVNQKTGVTGWELMACPNGCQTYPAPILNGQEGAYCSTCPAGSVWVVSQYDAFNSFCGETCASSAECPTGMACVLDIFGLPDPMVPVCMSDSVPPPLAAPGYIAVDSPLSTCLDSVTLGKLYVNQKTGVTGWELIPCPNGCQKYPAPILWGQEGAYCSDQSIDAGADAAAESDHGGVGPADVVGSAGTCPAGSVWVVSQTDDFNPFCGQTCTSSVECPTGMACVKDIFNYAVPMVPVCMSDSVPPPLAAPIVIAIDSPLSTCLDSVTLGKLYVNQKTGVTGWELIPCPNGCQKYPDPILWGQEGAYCL